MIDPGLSGKTILITGAQNRRGIGAATARAFARQGAHVFLTYFRAPEPDTDALSQALTAGVGGDLLYRALQQQPIDGLLTELSSSGVDVAAIEADLHEASNVARIFEACEDAIGPVDVLVNNHAHCVLDTFDPTGSGAGLPPAFRRPDQPISAALIDDHYAVNTRATVLLMAEFVKRQVERGSAWGRIVNVTSAAADCHPSHASYVASKHAVESYSRTAACEVGQFGITVNVVAPGPVQTGYMEPEMEAAAAARIPMGRVGAPEDVADVIVFLASAQARWLTGQLIYALAVRICPARPSVR